MTLGDVGLLVGFTGLLVLVFEISARLASEIPFWPPVNFLAGRGTMVRDNPVLRFDPLLGWALQDRHSSNGLNITDHGLRIDPENPPAALTDGILVIGGSFAMGSGVWDKDTWPAQLERRLRALGDGNACVLNGGCGGWAVDQIVLRAESLCDALRPRAVILAFTAMNVEDVALVSYAGISKPYFEPTPDGEPVLRNAPAPHSLVPLRTLSLSRRSLGFSYLVYWLADQLGFAGWKATAATVRRPCDAGALARQVLRRFEQFARARAIRTLYVHQYSDLDVLDRQEKPFSWISRFLDGLRADGMDVLDLWPWIHGDYRKAGILGLVPWFLVSNGNLDHLSPEGNRRAAEIVATHLLQMQSFSAS